MTLYDLLLQLWRDDYIVIEWNGRELIDDTIRMDGLDCIASWYMQQDMAEFVTEALLDSPWARRLPGDLDEHDPSMLGQHFQDALQHEAEVYVKRSPEWERLKDYALEAEKAKHQSAANY